MSRAARLPSTEIQRLSRLSAMQGGFDVLAPWALIFAAAAAAHAGGGWYGHLLAIIVIGSRQAALANLAHDAWHRLCFRSRWLNDAVGAWLYAYPVGVPFHHDRRRHFAHHRLVGQPEDPDWVNYTSEGRETTTRVLGYLLGRLAGSLLVETAWSTLVTRKPRILLSEDARKEDEPAHEMLRVVICQLLLLALFTLFFGWWGYPLYWLLPIATVTAFCNNLRALVEHVAEDPSAAPEVRLRDIDATWLERLFFSPSHFHFHALHHANPSIPHYRLGTAKKTLIEATGSYPYGVSPGYLRTLMQHLSALARKAAA
jgi:fatty acid desaturase